MDRQVEFAEFEPEDYRADGEGVEVAAEFRDHNPQAVVSVRTYEALLNIDTEMFENWFHCSEERWMARDSFRSDKVDLSHVKKEMSGKRICIAFFTALLERREEEGFNGVRVTKTCCHECIPLFNTNFIVKKIITKKLERRYCNSVDNAFLMLVTTFMKYCDFCEKMCFIYKCIN